MTDLQIEPAVDSVLSCDFNARAARAHAGAIGHLSPADFAFALDIKRLYPFKFPGKIDAIAGEERPGAIGR